jgi:predicted DNA-binding transcriptional regulator AlpA
MTPETIIALDGVEQPISEHALDWGIPASLIIARLHDGWDKREAIETPMPVRKGQRLRTRRTTDRKGVGKPHGKTLTFNGETLTVKQWSERTGINRHTINYRLRQGWSIEAVLTTAISGTITHDGKTMAISEWSRLTGIKEHTIYHRLKRGWSIERAVTARSCRNRWLAHNGETLTVNQWSERTGISRGNIRSRLHRGWSIERALTP